MKKTLENILAYIFSIGLMIALLGGGITFIIFLAAILMGGSIGETLATSAFQQIMPYFIRLSTIAVLSGLLKTYLNGKHALSLNENSNGK